MAVVKAQNSRDHPFYHVTDLLVKVGRKPGSYLSAEDLDRLGIKLSSMNIETGTPADSGPQFCDLYPSQEFDNLFKERVPFDTIQLWPMYQRDEYSAAYGVGLFLGNCLRMNGDKEPLAYKNKYKSRG